MKGLIKEIGHWLLGNRFPIIVGVACAITVWMLVPASWQDVLSFWRYREPAEIRLANAKAEINRLSTGPDQTLSQELTLKFLELGAQKYQAANELWESSDGQDQILAHDVADGVRVMALAVKAIADHHNIKLLVPAPEPPAPTSEPPGKGSKI